MKACREVQAALPEYLSGRPALNASFIATHLEQCPVCRGTADELQLVFALLAAQPEPPASSYGEANARLALQTMAAPGPLRANEFARRQEDLRLRICSVLSFAGAGSLACGAVALFNMRGGSSRSASTVGHWLLSQIQGIPFWEGLAIFTLMGGFASMIPVLMQGGMTSPYSRRNTRREV